MIEDFDSQTDSTQSDLVINASLASKASATPKKGAISGFVYKSTPSTQHHFVAEVRMRNPHDLIMIARDPFHHLYCELPLRFQKDQQERGGNLSLICQFPLIGDCALVDFIEEDEELLGFIMICFHLQILENLFLFCNSRKADTLVIKTMKTDFQAGLEIYEGFIKSIKKTQNQQGVDMEIMIPIHAESLEDCRIYMDDVMEKFRHTLWQNQKINLAMRAYVFRNLRMSVVASIRKSEHQTSSLRIEREETDND